MVIALQGSDDRKQGRVMGGKAIDKYGR